jgi:hypothetical protein
MISFDHKKVPLFLQLKESEKLYFVGYFPADTIPTREGARFRAKIKHPKSRNSIFTELEVVRLRKYGNQNVIVKVAGP